MDKTKRKKKDGNALAAVLLIALCAGVGFLVGSIGAAKLPKDENLLLFLARCLLQLLLLFAAYYIQIVIHEAGHLIAGLMTGYCFSSFRIGSLMLLRTHEGYRLKKFSLAGTGGQCLLIPPEKNADGTYPYKLYHLGGILLNLITAALCFVIYLIGSAQGGMTFFLFLAMTGLLCVITNGIPVRISGIATDGYNVIHIGKEPFALDAMWLQLKINEAQVEGARLKDLPEEWFMIPENAGKSNEIISAIAVFSENRAMDALDFRKAGELIRTLEESEEYSLIGLYRSLLLFDRITLDLIENGASADLSELDKPQNKGFRKAMANYPAVIRTEYAIRLLKDKDFAAAEKCKELFQKVSASYPMRSDIESETQIMEYLEAAAN